MPFVKQHRTYYKYGTEPNATIVGSPTIVEGVVSGFSGSNYLSLPETFIPVSGDTWEIGFEVTTGSNVTTQQTILGSIPPNCGGIWLALGRNSKASLDLSVGSGTDSSSDWNIVNHIAGTTTITANTTYYIKIIFTGSEYQVLISTNNIDWIKDISVTSSAVPSAYTNKIGICLKGGSTYDYPWLGSIDLTQSYIKINNKDWWYGTKAVELNTNGYNIYQDWVQPVFTSATTWGEVSADNNYSGEEAWRALDNDSASNFASSSGNSVNWYWHFKEPLVINEVEISQRSSAGSYGGATTYTIYGLNENRNYEQIGSISLSATAFVSSSVKVESEKQYHGLKIYCSGTKGNVGLSNLKLTAQTLKAVAGTIEEADYYVNHNKLYQLAAVKRSYWKYDYRDFVQPVLSANGTMGGDKFAVNSISTDSNYPAYKSFDGDRSGWGAIFYKTSGYLEFYNPNPLKVSFLNILNFAGDAYGVRSIKKGYIQASNDGTEYKTIKEFTNDIVGGGQNWNIDLSDNANGYKYYRIVATDTSYADSNAANQTVITELTITAQELVKVGSTDYDTYTDKLLSYAPIVRGKRTYYKQSEKQQDTGTYTFTLDKDYTAKMLFVGNGGGGCSSQKDSQWWYASGGSGACFEGTVRLPADTYTLTIGTLGYGNNSNNVHWHSGGVESTDSYLTNSAGEELIRVGCGAKGNTAHTSTTGGVGGVLTLGTLNIIGTKKAVNGNQTTGNSSAGSLSAYDGTYSGYGAGTCGTRGAGNVYGIKGVFDLVLETDINDYTYYEDIGTKIY